MGDTSRIRAYDVSVFIALLATAMALGAALAHAFELLNKINLGQSEYFIMQKAYRGWNQLAFVLLIELLSQLAVAVFARREPYVFAGACIAILSLLCAQGVFWVFTYPANVATTNWTVAPANWSWLRDRWEYSHLAGAGFQLIAMSALACAAVARSRSSTALTRSTT
jgi:hypothetical protein